MINGYSFSLNIDDTNLWGLFVVENVLSFWTEVTEPAHSYSAE